jgi:5-methylcytosine-specific restriction endonuclease McrA
VHGPRCTHTATTVDHIVPRVDGGDMWDTHNLRAACVACNSRGGAAQTNAKQKRTRFGYVTTLADYDTRF